MTATLYAIVVEMEHEHVAALPKALLVEEIARWAAVIRAALCQLTEAFKRECDDVDEILRHLGLNPERCRTEGGALNVGRVKADWADRLAALGSAEPCAWRYAGPKVYQWHDFKTEAPNEADKWAGIEYAYLHPDARGADAVTDAMVSAAIETFGMKPSWGAMKRALDAAIKAGGV